MSMKILLLLGLTLSGASWAQECPPGTIGPGCLPPNDPRSPYADNQEQAPSAPRMIWADRWGAIAMDGTVDAGGVGTVVGMSSKRKAEKAAIEKCRATGGGQGCKVLSSYENGCGVIAWGDNTASTAHAPTIEQASEIAMENCGKKTSNCSVYYAECSMAERIQ